MSQNSWTNNALLAGVIATIAGVILTFIFGFFESKPEVPGTPERRRADAEQMVSDIADVRRQIDLVGRSIALGDFTSDVGPGEAQQQYLELREQHDRVSTRTRLAGLNEAVREFLDAYDIALNAADTAFDCAHNLLRVKQNQYSNRTLSVSTLPHSLNAACPERIDLDKGNPHYGSFSEVVDALENCEAELATAAETIAVGRFAFDQFMSCLNIPQPPALTYAISLD